jgi:uncharacterized membrane protein YheB (UPF0754 family)
MTSQIQEKLVKKIDTMNKKEDEILQSDMRQDEEIARLHDKLDQIIAEIDRLKTRK